MRTLRSTSLSPFARSSSFAFLPLAMVAISACGGEAAPPPYAPPSAVVPVKTATVTPPPPVQDNGRLPKTVTPLRVALNLSIDPTKDHFSGTERILFKADQPTSYIVLNAKALTIKSAVVTSGGTTSSATTTARVAHGGFEPEELILACDPPIPAGEGEIELTWEGGYSPNLMGMSRENDDGRWYAFTDFEPSHARNVFPMFDEPSYKVPYDVSVRAPSGMLAFGNSPETTRVVGNDGTTTFTFDTTPPLPSYLVAVAVGDMDIRTATTAGAPPVRVLTTKGKGAMADLSLKDGVGLTKALGDYFGIAYPYKKLDLVAVPDFAPGAMENPGLITFREVLLLADPAHTAAAVRRRQERVISHELAHQWFGDLVTLAWWNDTWLNEGFASWAETKAVEKYRPESHAVLERTQAMDNVMNDDALGSARAVRQPVTSVGEAMEAFDRITYDKGAAVLGMIEAWVGEATFQHGVSEYLKSHAWGNATAKDLFDSLEKASSKPVGAVTSSFVDRPGVPQIDVAITCDKGSWSAALKESTWRPLGTAASANGSSGDLAAWKVPVCIRTPGQTDNQCAQVDGQTPQVITGSGACPAYIVPNAGMHGYYRAAMNEAETLKVARAAAKANSGFGVPERLGVISDAWAGVKTGRLPPSVILQILPLFDHDDERLVIEQVVTTLRAMNDAVVEDAAKPAFRAYVKARLSGHKARFGWSNKGTKAVAAGSDPEDPSLIRRSVLAALGDIGGDEATLKEADSYAQKWIADPSSVDPDIAQIAVELASHPAKEDRIAALAKPEVHGATPEVRLLAAKASAQFDDPAVENHALDRVLTDDVKKQDVMQVIGPALRYPGSRKTALAWVETNWDALRKKLTGALARQTVTASAYACTQAEYDSAKSFFTPRAKDIESANRILNASLETSTLCTALHTQQAPAVSQYFHVKAGAATAAAPRAAATAAPVTKPAR